jgi:hypothetical protein
LEDVFDEVLQRACDKRAAVFFKNLRRASRQIQPRRSTSTLEKTITMPPTRNRQSERSQMRRGFGDDVAVVRLTSLRHKHLSQREDLGAAAISKTSVTTIQE